MIVALVLTVVSMLDYIAKARRLIGLARADGTAGAREGAKAGEAALDELAAHVLRRGPGLRTHGGHGREPHGRPSGGGAPPRFPAARMRCGAAS